jgi:uncharacterized membrane protein
VAAFLVLASEVPAAPVLALMGAGVIVAIVGHATRSQRATVAGLALVFLATALMVLGAYVAYQDDAGSDPRPEENRQTPF